MDKKLNITHPKLVGYLTAGLVEKAIIEDLDIDFTEVIGLIDNAVCDLADENGNINASGISDAVLEEKLKNILPQHLLEDIIKEAFVIFWMYSQDF